MYGLIILTVKDLVLKKFGEKAWKKICSAANASEVSVSGWCLCLLLSPLRVLVPRRSVGLMFGASSMSLHSLFF
jgi:hypothetical protein